MLYEVHKNGQPKMVTDTPSCIPSSKEIQSLKQAGYKIKDNRKGREG